MCNTLIIREKQDQHKINSVSNIEIKPDKTLINTEHNHTSITILK